MGFSYEIVCWWMPLNTFDIKSILAQVMAWCHLATRHYLSQCWPRPMLPFGVISHNELKWWCLKILLDMFIRCQIKNEDVVGAAPTGNTPTTSVWSIIVLPAKVHLILQIWWQSPNQSNCLQCHWIYRKLSNIRRTKTLNLNVSRLVVQLSLPNPMNPGVKSRTKM